MHLEEQLPNTDGWHGSTISLTIEGNWTYYRWGRAGLGWRRRAGLRRRARSSKEGERT